MRKNKIFFDEDITINEKLFDGFKIENIVSWSHLELWCAILNVEVNYAFFKGILCGTVVINKLFEIILDAICNTDFLDKFIANVEVIEMIEKLYDCNKIGRTFKAKEFWIDLAYEQDEGGAYHDYFSSGTIIENKKKYQLLNAIFYKNPFVILKFYDKHKLTIHLRDLNFEMWLLNRCKNLSEKTPLFKDIYDVLCVESKKQQNISMHLN